MGIITSILNYFGYGTGRTDDPDPVTGLTSRDKYLVTRTWSYVRKDPTKSGVALLNVFFKNHPEYLRLFPFRDVPVEELPNNKKYQAHANAIIYSFSSLVDTLNEDELLVAMLTKLAESHVHRKVTEQSFIHLKESLIELFSPFIDQETVQAWQKTLDVTFEVLTKAVREKLKASQ